jgi:enhancing lycopene biosynthesis protein 2
MALVAVAAAAGLAAGNARAWGNPHTGAQPHHHRAAPRVGVLLYGAGMMDGSEVQEVVLTLLALEQGGAQVVAISPAGPQAEVVNHQTRAVVTSETRDMLIESARLTHGGVVPLSQVDPDTLDALIVPGGLGFTKSITTFARDGKDLQLDPAVSALLATLHAQRKPLAFLCITPIAAARLFGAEHPRLTLGTDPGMAAVLEALGARPVQATAQEVVVDGEARLVSSPAYMVGPDLSTVAVGIGRAVDALLDLAGP